MRLNAGSAISRMLLERPRPIARARRRRAGCASRSTRVPSLTRPARGDHVHLRLVGADEEIDRRAVDDLPRQHVRRGEVEADRRRAASRRSARATAVSASVRLTAAETVMRRLLRRPGPRALRRSRHGGEDASEQQREAHAASLMDSVRDGRRFSSCRSRRAAAAARATSLRRAGARRRASWRPGLSTST